MLCIPIKLDNGCFSMFIGALLRENLSGVSNLAEQVRLKLVAQWLVSVAEETGLSLALSETPKTVLLHRGPSNVHIMCTQRVSTLVPTPL